jgi:hypothetical protein
MFRPMKSIFKENLFTKEQIYNKIVVKNVHKVTLQRHVTEHC